MDIAEANYYFYTQVGHSLTTKQDKLWKRRATAEPVGVKLYIEVKDHAHDIQATRYLKHAKAESISFAANQMVDEIKKEMRRKREPA